MATPEPQEPASATRRIDTAPARTARIDPDRERTRWITRVLRPGGRAAPPAAEGAVAPTRQVRRPATGGPSPAGGAPSGRWWRPGSGPSWLSRLVSRVVVGPAGELDYAIPAELRRSYTVLGHIGSGGEAIVYLARPAASDEDERRLALKVYRPGHDINRELLDRLRARGETAPHTPAIHGYGYARSAWGEDVAWEAQEYFAGGSLRSVLDRAPLPDEEARRVVAAVAECLRYWQESLQHNHTDVKPENLLVRDPDGPVFALTDFGGAVRATMSRVYGGLAITEDYAAPEVVEGRREAPAAWWSLGVMVHELRTGRRPERGENWLTARTTEVDVSAITEEDWRLLARGLLTPVPSARWGYAEVRQWLAGERPEIVPPRRHAPIRFADVSHDDPPSLAFDLLDRADKGEVWLRAHWPELRTWLDREVNDYTFDRGYLTDLGSHPERAHLAISAFAAHYVPGMPPRFRGHEVSADGVLALAAGEPSRHALLREAVELGVLGLAARHWCGHPGCRAEGSGRCALLERVQHEVPLVLRRVEETVRRVRAGGADGVPDPPRHEWDTAWARAAELVLDAEAASRLRRTLRAQSWHPARRSAAPHADWWREQRRAALRGRQGEVATNAALVSATLLLPAAAEAGAAQRERDRADTRARWRGRRTRLAEAAGAGWSRVRERLPGGDGAPPAAPPAAPYGGGPAPYTPFDQAERDRQARRRAGEERRVDRGMQQIQRAMGAGRCRRFAYPAAVLGLVDALGRILRADGFYPDSSGPFAAAYTSLVEFGRGPVMSALSGAARGVTGLLPGTTASQWWLPAVLALVLLVLGRTAANRKRRARTQLAAYRLAVAGTVLMAIILLSHALITLGAGILIPLYNAFG